MSRESCVVSILDATTQAGSVAGLAGRKRGGIPNTHGRVVNAHPVVGKPKYTLVDLARRLVKKGCATPAIKAAVFDDALCQLTLCAVQAHDSFARHPSVPLQDIRDGDQSGVGDSQRWDIQDRRARHMRPASRQMLVHVRVCMRACVRMCVRAIRGFCGRRHDSPGEESLSHLLYPILILSTAHASKHSVPETDNSPPLAQCGQASSSPHFTVGEGPGSALNDDGRGALFGQRLQRNRHAVRVPPTGAYKGPEKKRDVVGEWTEGA